MFFGGHVPCFENIKSKLVPGKSLIRFDDGCGKRGSGIYTESDDVVVKLIPLGSLTQEAEPVFITGTEFTVLQITAP